MENIIEYFDTVHAPALILTLDAQKILSNLASILLLNLTTSFTDTFYLISAESRSQDTISVHSLATIHEWEPLFKSSRLWSHAY